MIEAAAVVRERGPGGFAGLDRESADALAALLETLAEDWRERPTLRGCGSTRPDPRPPAPGARPDPRAGPTVPRPVPAGYEPAPG